MPLTFQSTPNPLALKCVPSAEQLTRLAPPPGIAAPRSYRSASEASTDPFAATLFTIPGITNVLIHDAWFTISKDQSSQWKPIKAAITKLLA